MPEYVEGKIYLWEKPERSGTRYNSLADALIAARGVRDTDGYVNPRLENDPFYGFVASRAEQFFGGEAGRVLISSDYDVDGTTSAVILGRAFKALGWQIRIFIPNRFQDNYGVNYNRMEELYKEWPYTRLITSDCGATELAGLSKFSKEKGVEVMVLDHHKRGAVGEGVLEINPHMGGADVQEHGYSTAVLAAMLIRAGMEKYPCLRPLLTGAEILAGLSAMADSASMLVQGARYCAKAFLAGANSSDAGPGVRALIDVAGITQSPTTTDINFKVIPLINAAGRLRDADIIVALFQEEDPSVARDIAEKLKTINKKRRMLQESVQQQALSLYREGDRVLIACHKDWHPGVVGPAAGQIAELLGIPVFLGGFVPARKTFSFSGRSGNGTDIHALLKVSVGDLPVHFGGHKVALGLKIGESDIECLDKLREALLKNAPKSTKPRAKISKVLRPASMNLANWNELTKMEPFGVDNPSPLFCLPNVTLKMQLLPSIANSCKGVLTDETGHHIPVLIFRNAKLAGTRSFHGHVVGELVNSINRNMNEMQFIIKDIIPQVP